MASFVHGVAQVGKQHIQKARLNIKTRDWRVSSSVSSRAAMSARAASPSDAVRPKIIKPLAELEAHAAVIHHLRRRYAMTASTNLRREINHRAQSTGGLG